MKNRIVLSVLVLLVLAALVSTTAGQMASQKIPNIAEKYKPIPLVPKITGASYFCAGAACRELGVQGQFFGATQGTRRLLVNGSPIPIFNWAAGQIIGTGPVWDVDHTYNIAIDNGTSVISNVLSKQFLFQWDVAMPGHAAAGATVELVGWGGGSSQAGKTVKVGSAAAVIVSWTQSSPAVSENHIRITVPNLPAGTYPINVFKGGTNVTKAPLNFKID